MITATLCFLVFTWGVVMASAGADEMCRGILNNLQANMMADVFKTHGASCSKFSAAFAANATFASPSWAPAVGRPAIEKSCRQFNNPWKASCELTFQFTFTTVHGGENVGKLWCSGTGVFAIGLARRDATDMQQPDSCIMQGVETDVVMTDISTGMIEYASTVYDYNSFGAEYEACGTKLCT